ncbi:MAG: GNAT family N-acetyltransferase [Clostridium sp.]|jgi:GNAT superfamily N-acetyltransferase|nr:GNAT family N-acetyltransferase [Clostridium sp.]
MKLVWRTFLKFEGNDYSELGIQNFREFITDGNLQNAFLRGEYQMLIAKDMQRIIGVASLRDRNHLSLLFVDEHYHRRGVGRRLLITLFHYLRDEVGESSMSLKASPYALNFYLRLGFRQTADVEEYAGIRATPMERRI